MILYSIRLWELLLREQSLPYACHTFVYTRCYDDEFREQIKKVHIEKMFGTSLHSINEDDDGKLTKPEVSSI
ncbi:Hypothetical predicted protein [Octopus vulgaris]|uniref:Uncharacterized protein n=1 Tax=Octopus vulgaris TaxID=6645 RepID=A0AA36B3L6_OCTVU|nr:Hypothetical predicted protein [Octopus vulgaris]